MSKFVRSNGSPRLPGVPQQRLYGDQVAMGEPFQLHGNAELTRDIQSSLEIIAQERLLEVEAQAKALLVRGKEEAAKILEAANAQAQALLEQARGEVDGIREAAHEEGFKAGYEEGYADATAQVTEETRELLAGAQVLVDGAYLAEKRVMKHFEARTLELIRHIVRQIIDREMMDSPATVMRVVERAIESLYLGGKVQVVVSAQVIHELRGYATATEQGLEAMNRFEFIADPALERHQIFIIGQDSCFDLSPDTQLDHLLSALEPHFELSRELPEPLAVAPQNPTGENAQESATVSKPEITTSETVTGLGDANLPSHEVSPEPANPELTPEFQAIDEAPLLLPMADTSAESGLPDSAAISTPSDILPEVTQPASKIPLELAENAATDPEVASEMDPVAWEEFPADIQQLAEIKPPEALPGKELPEADDEAIS